MKYKSYNLPCYDTRKSFYGKAKVEVWDDTILLRSYNTIVCKIMFGGKFVRMWNGYSATTMRHINSFLLHLGYPLGGKKWWDSCKVNEPYDLKAMLEEKKRPAIANACNA